MANIPMPSYKFSQYKLMDQDGNVDQRFARGKLVSTVNVHDPFWTLQIETSPMYFDDAREWKTFIRKANQSNNRALADPTYSVMKPRAYPNGGGTDAEIQVRTLTDDTFTVIALPNSYQVRAGDLVRFKDGDNYHLAEVQLSVTATPGGNAEIRFWPPIPSTGFAPFSATAAFENIEMIWRIVPGSVQHEQSIVTEKFSFQLESVMR